RPPERPEPVLFAPQAAGRKEFAFQVPRTYPVEDSSEKSSGSRKKNQDSPASSARSYRSRALLRSSESAPAPFLKPRAALVICRGAHLARNRGNLPSMLLVALFPRPAVRVPGRIRCRWLRRAAVNRARRTYPVEPPQVAAPIRG